MQWRKAREMSLPRVSGRSDFRPLMMPVRIERENAMRLPRVRFFLKVETTKGTSRRAIRLVLIVSLF